MDKKQSTAAAATAASRPLGMCEKLFNAFQPTLHPLRRLTFRQQELGSANNADPSHPIDKAKLPEPISAPSKVQQTHNPKTKIKSLPSPAPPKSDVVPISTVPQPPKSEKATKKGINEKVDEYIARTKGRIKSTVSNVGKVAASK